jgi:hypothetical protein
VALLDWTDYGNRVKALFPKSWAGAQLAPNAWNVTGTPATNGRLGSLTYGLVGGLQSAPSGLPFISTQLAYAKLQCRMLTITDTNVDQVGLDWFRNVVPRVPGELDRAYASRLVLTLTAGCPSIPGLTKILQAYLSAWLAAPNQSVPFADDTSGGVDQANSGLDSGGLGQVSAVPIAVDTSGAVDTWGYLDQASSATSLGGPAVYIFDHTSDPATSAIVGITDPQFGVALVYPGVNLNLLVSAASVSRLFSTMVQAFKAPGTIQTFWTNGPG